MYRSNNSPVFDSESKLNLEETKSGNLNNLNSSGRGISSFLSSVKKKISNFFFINNEDGKDEGNLLLKNYPATTNIVPSYINENEHIYDAPSLYYYNNQNIETSKKIDNIDLNDDHHIMQHDYSEKRGRRLSEDSSKTTGTKRKVNSLIKIMNYITNKKFNDKRKVQDTASTYSQRKSAFKLINNPYKNICLDSNKIINYNDLFEVTKDKNIIRPVPVRKDQKEDFRTINKKRSRFEDKIDYDGLSLNNKKRKLTAEDNQSVFSSVNNLNKYKNIQREDVSMHSINSILASQKEIVKKTNINDDVSMHIRTDNKSIFIKSIKSKTLDDIKREIEEKRSSNRRMIDEMSKRSSRRSDFRGAEFDYEERKKYLTTYYLEKEKAAKDKEILPEIKLTPSLPLSTYDLTRERNYSLTKSSISIPSSASQKKEPVVVIEKKEQVEICSKKEILTKPSLFASQDNLGKNQTPTIGKIEQEQVKKPLTLFNNISPLEKKEPEKANDKKEVENPQEKKEIEKKEDNLFKGGQIITLPPIKTEKQAEVEPNKSATLFSGALFSGKPSLTSTSTLSTGSSTITPSFTTTVAPTITSDTSNLQKPILFGDKTAISFGAPKEKTMFGAPKDTIAEKSSTPLQTQSEIVKTPSFVADNKPVFQFDKKQENTDLNKKQEEKIETTIQNQSSLIKPGLFSTGTETKEMKSPFSTKDVIAPSQIETKIETKPAFGSTSLFSSSNLSTAEQKQPVSFFNKEEKKESLFGVPSTSTQGISSSNAFMPNKITPASTSTVETGVNKPAINITPTLSMGKEQSSSSLFNSNNPFIKASINPSQTGTNPFLSVKPIGTTGNNIFLLNSDLGKTESNIFSQPGTSLQTGTSNTLFGNKEQTNLFSQSTSGAQQFGGSNDNDMAISPITSPKTIPKTQDLPGLNTGQKLTGNTLFGSSTTNLFPQSQIGKLKFEINLGTATTSQPLFSSTNLSSGISGTSQVLFPPANLSSGMPTSGISQGLLSSGNPPTGGLFGNQPKTNPFTPNTTQGTQNLFTASIGFPTATNKFTFAPGKK